MGKGIIIGKGKQLGQHLRRIDLIENIADIVAIKDRRGQQDANVGIVVNDGVAMEGKMQAGKGISGQESAHGMMLEVD